MIQLKILLLQILHQNKLSDLELDVIMELDEALSGGYMPEYYIRNRKILEREEEEDEFEARTVQKIRKKFGLHEEPTSIEDLLRKFM